MAEEQSDNYKNIGRNDPCPCGSGKKYKKCCFRTHRIEQEAKKTTVSVDSVVGSKTTPWEFYKILCNVYSNNVANFFWELSHDQSPFRKHYGQIESFLAEIATGVIRLPAGPDQELVRIRHDGPDVLLLLASGHDDPKMQSVRADIITLRPNQIDADRKPRSESYYGYRVWSMESLTCPKAGLLGDDVTFEDFGIKWQPAWDAPEGWYKPIDSSDLLDVTEECEVSDFAGDSSNVSPAAPILLDKEQR